MVKIRKLKVLLVVVFILSAGFVWNNVLPYHFSPQYRPTSSTLNVSGQAGAGNSVGEYLGKKVVSKNIPYVEVKSNVLGAYDSIKRIEVDLTHQRVYAFEGNKKVMEFIVSTGKWGRTPTGTFRVAYKNFVQKMEGGNKLLGTYYNLPNVHYVQFFGNKQIPWSKGFSFHEAYWHENFGVPMSHGCINMRLGDAKKLYEWTTPSVEGKWWVKASKDEEGTLVMIYGETPDS